MSLSERASLRPTWTPWNRETLTESHSLGARSRGQSETIGFVLMFAVVTGGMITVVSIGSIAVDDTQTNLELERAEKTLTQFDSKAAMVALGQSDGQEVQLNTNGAEYSVNESAGNINITIYPGDGNNEVLVDQSLGEIRYENDEASIAYQGGGVWRAEDGNSTMVSPPEFHYRDVTLTIPIMSINDGEELGTSVTVSEDETGIEKFPTDSLDNPLEDADIELKVQSRYYEAWGQFFEERTSGNATIYHSNRTALLTLSSTTGNTVDAVTGAVVSGAASGEMTLDNKACIDSYDSSDGPYGPNNHFNCNNNADNGNVNIFSDLKLNQNTEVRGNVTAGGTVNLQGNGNQIRGYLKCAKGNHDCKDGSGKVKEDVLNVDESVPNHDPVDDLVDEKISELKTSNDNSAASDISGDSLDSGTVTLDGGEYYLNKIDRSDSNDVILNTTENEIILAVDGAFDLDDADVVVQGENTVRVYLADGGSNSELVLDNQAQVRTEDTVGNRQYNSTRFWLYSTSGFDGDIDTESEFTGVIYAPENANTDAGTVTMAGGVVFGAVVAHVDGMDENNDPPAIHYDEALDSSSAQQQSSPNAVNVTNMHLTVNRINITG